MIKRKLKRKVDWMAVALIPKIALLFPYYAILYVCVGWITVLINLKNKAQTDDDKYHFATFEEFVGSASDLEYIPAVIVWAVAIVILLIVLL